MTWGHSGRPTNQRDTGCRRCFRQHMAYKYRYKYFIGMCPSLLVGAKKQEEQLLLQHTVHQHQHAHQTKPNQTLSVTGDSRKILRAAQRGGFYLFSHRHASPVHLLRLPRQTEPEHHRSQRLIQAHVSEVQSLQEQAENPLGLGAILLGRRSRVPKHHHGTKAEQDTYDACFQGGGGTSAVRA